MVVSAIVAVGKTVIPNFDTNGVRAFNINSLIVVGVLIFIYITFA